MLCCAALATSSSRVCKFLSSDSGIVWKVERSRWKSPANAAQEQFMWKSIRSLFLVKLCKPLHKLDTFWGVSSNILTLILSNLFSTFFISLVSDILKYQIRLAHLLCLPGACELCRCVLQDAAHLHVACKNLVGCDSFCLFEEGADREFSSGHPDSVPAGSLASFIPPGFARGVAWWKLNWKLNRKLNRN